MVPGRKIYTLIAVLLQLSSLFSSPNDDLNDALRYLLANDFGYTLLGEKPASVVQELPRYVMERPEKRAQLFDFLRQTFSQSEVFIFKTISEQGYMELIHVPLLLHQVQKNTNLNSFVCKKFKNKENFIKQLRNPALNIFKALDHNPVLIAIVLGYGEINGAFFTRRMDVGILLQKYPIVSFFPFDQLPDPEHIKQISSEYDCLFKLPTQTIMDRKKLEEEWSSISALKSPDKNDAVPPEYISKPVFISKRGRESDIIFKKFNNTRIQLGVLLSNHSPIEIVLKYAS